MQKLTRNWFWRVRSFRTPRAWHPTSGYEWSVMLHDAATTHKGKKEPKRQAGQAAQPTVHHHFDSSGQPQALKAWLADRRVVEGDVPPGLASFRPNDQRMFNFLFRWKYDQTLAQLNGTTDFRAPHVDTDVRIVLTAVAIITKWLNEHPECGAAAWILSTVTEEADYQAQGKGKLFEKALQAMRDPAYQEITAEYKKNGGPWKTESWSWSARSWIPWTMPQTHRTRKQ